METSKKITVLTTVQASVDKVWTYWTEPTHITKWSNASDDWHTPFAENDLRFRREIPFENGSQRWQFWFRFWWHL